MEDYSKLSKQELIDRLQKKQEDSYTSQLQELDRISAKSNPMAASVRETQDHPDVYLYRELGDRMGPFHPDNAKDIIRRWKLKGFNLYLRKPTQEQIDAYKQTDLYKKRKAEEDEKNTRYKEQSAKNKPEHWAKLVAKETALAVKEAERIVKDK